MGCKCLRRYSTGTVFGLLEIEHIYIRYPQSIRGHTNDATMHKSTKLQSRI